MPSQMAMGTPSRVQPCVGQPVQSLGALDGNQEQNWCDLYFVDVIVNGRSVQALVDTGASHYFLPTKLAAEIGLRAQPCEASVKVVNSKAKAATEVASNGSEA